MPPAPSRPLLRTELHRYIGGILLQLDCQPLIVGGVGAHLHLLAMLSRTGRPAEMVNEVKRGSSLWIKERDRTMRDFVWQNGYGMFSVAYSQLEQVRRYIANQEEHHRKVGFQDELRRLLERYEIQYDERYVWD